jgi:hypothetical protein
MTVLAGSAILSRVSPRHCVFMPHSIAAGRTWVTR